MPESLKPEEREGREGWLWKAWRRFGGEAPVLYGHTSSGDLKSVVIH